MSLKMARTNPTRNGLSSGQSPSLKFFSLRSVILFFLKASDLYQFSGYEIASGNDLHS